MRKPPVKCAVWKIETYDQDLDHGSAILREMAPPSHAILMWQVAGIDENWWHNVLREEEPQTLSQFYAHLNLRAKAFPNSPKSRSRT